MAAESEVESYAVLERVHRTSPPSSPSFYPLAFETSLLPQGDDPPIVEPQEHPKGRRACYGTQHHGQQQG